MCILDRFKVESVLFVRQQAHRAARPDDFTDIDGLAVAAGSIVVTCIIHWVGIFDFLELKTYDYRFHSVRGPLTGWRASDSTIINLGTDVVLVEVDDESWRLLQEKKIPWPYPRGDIWATAVDNLTKAGAKVIAFDIQFDSPDARSEYLRLSLIHI